MSVCQTLFFFFFLGSRCQVLFFGSSLSWFHSGLTMSILFFFLWWCSRNLHCISTDGEILLFLAYCFIACLSEHLLSGGLLVVYITDLEYTNSMAEWETNIHTILDFRISKVWYLLTRWVPLVRQRFRLLVVIQCSFFIPWSWSVYFPSSQILPSKPLVSQR